MSDLLNTARAVAHMLLSHGSENITDESIQTAVKKVSAMNIVEGLTFDERELFEILRADFSVGKGEVTILSEDVEPWLNEELANINFELWNRYKLNIRDNDPSFPVGDLDDFTNKILDKCVNPRKPGAWDRRGMVVGHVQSGKTSNYVGLINKATDAGYKVIIVIAGTISSLRRQTQERIDSGYIGRSSSAFINNRGENRVIGVGKYKVSTDIYSLTSSYYKSGDEGDFSQSVANKLNIPIGRNPVVFVIKKNKSILENLIDWFAKNENVRPVEGSPRLFDVPALIIDDEADAASVNTSGDINDVKAINRLIRILLNMFNQSTFIGYTATPYANLFISQTYNDALTEVVKGREYKVGEDLFPRDFIVNIKAPTNYIGAAKMFGYENPVPELTKEPLEIFRAIDDYDPPFFKSINKENKANLPEYIPDTLGTAIKSFILTCAIRRLRGHEKKHNSMLVHVALLVKWIDKVAYLVNEKVKEYKNAILAEDEALLDELRCLYETDFLPTTRNVMENLDYKDRRLEQHHWVDVRAELKKAASKIEVRAVHGTRSTTNLQYHNIEEIDYGLYENGLSVIAVGGSRLSRGITLEGLSISYYIRTTRMYDSLMQMGRWFGYRPGYVDLCRLFTTSDIFLWFNHITMATEEMRNDFDELTATHRRPRDFRLKVRNHTGLLTITSLAKLHFSENIEISFSGSNLQTYQLLKTEAAIHNNFKALKDLIAAIGFPEEHHRIKVKDRIKYLLYRDQTPDSICDFIDAFKTDQPNIKNGAISEYIRLQSESGTINEWSICVVANTEERVFIDYEGNTQLDKREPNNDVMTYNLIFGGEVLTLGCNVRNQPKQERGSDYYLISKNQIDDIRDRQVDLLRNNLKTNEAIKGERKEEKKGLLLIYGLDERGTPGLKNKIPVVGFSLHFPTIDGEVKVSYTATIYNGFDDEMMEDDDNNDNG
ncbi:Z1 domain-containing protein [Chitinophaga horti]|uniref:Z1 domain-containing protein n=1 Tax=Chitinophaga horti TaxID=2920382 RepID=A0ABY6J8P6_9BACT|nr:Z1 domain-containing protein [Chitinophaga horti]UYQ94957.1 Z1 domain-containing protein [Chitinophaga horti]